MNDIGIKRYTFISKLSFFSICVDFWRFAYQRGRFSKVISLSLSLSLSLEKHIILLMVCK